MPQPAGKASPVIEALSSCTTRASGGNMNPQSRTAFIIECINNNLGPGRASAAVLPADEERDCQAVAAYLQLAGSQKDTFVAGCMKPN